MAAIFSIELRKIFWRKKYLALLAINAVIGFIVGTVGSSGLSFRAIASLAPSASRQSLALGALSAYRSALLPLVIFMLASDVFAHEIENKSVKCVLTRPLSRLEAYFSKSAAILCYVAVSLGVGFAVFSAWQAFAPGGARAGAAAGASVAVAGFPAFLETFASYALTIVPMAAFVAMAAFIAVLVRSPALVMFLCIAAYGALAFVGTFAGGTAGAALFTTYTSWYRMWVGARVPLRSLAASAGLLASTCAIFFGLGYIVFDRKDI